MSQTITAEQAESLAKYDCFAVDRFQRYSGWFGPEDVWTAPTVWVDADAECERCEGHGCDADYCTDCGDEYTDPCPRHARHVAGLPCDNGCCGTCHSTGRQTATLLVTCDHPEEQVIQDDNDDQTCTECGATAFDHTNLEGRYTTGPYTIQVVPIVGPDHEDYLTEYVEVGAPGWTRIVTWDEGLKEHRSTHINLPPGTKPGQFLIIATKVET